MVKEEPGQSLVCQKDLTSDSNLSAAPMWVPDNSPPVPRLGLPSEAFEQLAAILRGLTNSLGTFCLSSPVQAPSDPQACLSQPCQPLGPPFFLLPPPLS